MTFTPPPTSADQPPAFASAGECGAWLQDMPLSNPAQVQAQLLRQLNLLNRFSLPAAERFDILELLREPVVSVQEESVRRFAGRPLPLAPQEQSAFDACQALWRALIDGYLHCLEGCLADDATIRPQAARVVGRALTAGVACQADIYRGGRQPDANHWRMMHRLHAATEQMAVTPHSAYVESLLLHAVSPNDLSMRQLAWMVGWVRRFSVKVAILAAPPTLSTRAIPLCVDLSSGEPASYRPHNGESVRWLETVELGHSLKKRLVLLEQGRSPDELHLGRDCSQPACGQLLKQAYLRWCKGGAIRQHERFPADGQCPLICGIDAAHYYLSGRKPFRQPGGHVSAEILRREREEIATFGHVATRHLDDFSQQQGYQVESWKVGEDEPWHMFDKSAMGLHVTRTLNQGGVRVGTGLLVVVRPGGDAQNPLLGCVRWARMDSDDLLHAGIHVFPGKPEPVAVRATGSNTTREYRQAFLLPAASALKEPASMVIPSGWFKLGRILDVLADQEHPLRLTRLLDRGSDFERAAYEMVTS